MHRLYPAPLPVAYKQVARAGVSVLARGIPLVHCVRPAEMHRDKYGKRIIIKHHLADGAGAYLNPANGRCSRNLARPLCREALPRVCLLRPSRKLVSPRRLCKLRKCVRANRYAREHMLLYAAVKFLASVYPART